MHNDTISTSRGSRPASRRAGLTLMELLVVMMIIAILAAMFLGALSSAQRLSQTTNTKSLLQKLHNALMSRWDAYRSVRLPIVLEAKSGGGFGDAGSEKNKFRQDIARRKMLATRELLRMEMPDRYEDLLFEPVYLIGPTGRPVRPYLWNSYNRKVLEAKVIAAKTDPSIGGMSTPEFLALIGDKYQSAECLYMIMTLGTEQSSTSTEHFAAREIGDVDGDGMKEFVDAWGNPIEFLRWAPGFTSPMQPVYSYDYPGAANTPGTIFHATQTRDPNNGNKIVSHWKVQFEKFTNTNAISGTISDRIVVIDQDDPFNPMRVGPVAEGSSTKWSRSSRWRPGDEGPEHGFILIPLIYSCGPDRESGINHCYGSQSLVYINDFEKDGAYQIKQSPTQGDREFPNIRFSDPYNVYRNSKYDNCYRGSAYPVDSPVGGRSLDNITNHDVGTR